MNEPSGSRCRSAIPARSGRRGSRPEGSYGGPPPPTTKRKRCARILSHQSVEPWALSLEPKRRRIGKVRCPGFLRVRVLECLTKPEHRTALKPQGSSHSMKPLRQLSPFADVTTRSPSLGARLSAHSAEFVWSKSCKSTCISSSLPRTQANAGQRGRSQVALRLSNDSHD